MSDITNKINSGTTLFRYAVVGLALTSLAFGASDNDMAGFASADDTMDQARSTGVKAFGLVVMGLTWALYIGATWFTLFHVRKKLVDKAKQEQGEDIGMGVWVKSGASWFVAMLVVSFVVILLWGRLIPITGNTSANYGQVIVKAVAGDISAITE